MGTVQLKVTDGDSNDMQPQLDNATGEAPFLIAGLSDLEKANRLMLSFRYCPALEAVCRKDYSTICSDLTYRCGQCINMATLNCGIPVFALDNNLVLVKTFLMAHQDVDLPWRTRSANKSNVALDRDCSGLVKLRDELLESAPVGDETGQPVPLRWSPKHDKSNDFWSASPLPG